MANTVVMPVCKRPEMLALALEALDRTQADLDVRIYADTQTNLDEVEYTRDVYFPDALIFHAKPHAQVPSGMWNILGALKAGYHTGSPYVFLVEEDVVVKPDFFDWHMEAQRTGDYLATCGRRMRNYPQFVMYTNPGACFAHDKLGLVVEHINDDLFSNSRVYMDMTFGSMDESSDLDDGLIRRVARQHQLTVKYPESPKCSHIGFRGYRQLDIAQNDGDIATRIAGLRQMLAKIDVNARYFSRDLDPL